MTLSPTTELDQTIAALQGDLATTPTETVLSLIESIASQVARLSDAGGIASGLAQLKQLLNTGTATPVEVGQVLSELGAQTRTVASKVDADVKGKLEQLSELLIQVGQSLLQE
jgi:hypothetical protein